MELARQFIAVDVRMASASGIGTYIRNVLPLIIDDAAGIHFYLLGSPAEMQRGGWCSRANVTLVECRSPIYSIREQLELKRRTPRNTSIFWAPHYNIPILFRGRLVVTIHDVIHLALREYSRDLHKYVYSKLMFNQVARRAWAVCTDSHFTRTELIHYTGIDDRKVRTVHLGVGSRWFETGAAGGSPRGPFLLYVGNLKPHKNVAMLIRAFKAVAHRIPHRLVIVGRREGFITGENDSVTEAAKLEGRVEFTGEVDDSTLRKYVTHAEALVLPSLYEGFGLPTLEAMAAGCPVIVSDIAPLREVCGDAALYCDPRSSDDIGAKIVSVMEDKALRGKLRACGLRRARKFSWQKCAEQTLGVLEQVLASPSPPF